MAEAKKTTATYRLTEEDLAILDEVQRRMGLFTRSDAIRYVVREHARREGIVVASPKPKRKK